MTEWYCFKCKQKMIETEMTSSYMEVVGFVKSLKCPQCRAAYLTEEVAVDVVSKGESEIEAKLG